MRPTAGAMPRARPSLHDLPEGHRIVLGILADLDRGEGVTWEELREAAASKGIGAEELHWILTGRPIEDGA